jgi:signal peptidase I
MKTWTVRRLAALGLSAAIVVLGWYALAPTQLGGRTVYVTTSGTSMEPLLHAGDLAVVRATDEYHIGDVVAYRNHELNAVVLHRIVAISDGRYTFKGDNNTWVDDDRPTVDALLGEMALRIPEIGGRLQGVRSPWGLSAVTGMTVVGIAGERRSRRKRRRHRSSDDDRTAGRRSPSRPRAGSGTLAAVSGGVAILAGVLAAVAFALPTTALAHHDVSYREQGSFSYSASAGPASMAVYGRSNVTTGDPVYLRLSDAVDVRFEYDVRTDAAFEGGGTTALVAVVSDGSGWARSVTLAPVASFTGGRAAVEGTLHLPQLWSVIGRVQRLTGVAHDAYSVTVRPEISLDGRLAGETIHRIFAPALAFQLDRFELQLSPAAIGADDGTLDPVHPSSSGHVTTAAVAPRQLHVLGIEMPLRAVRVSATALLGLAVAGIALALVTRRRAARHGEAAAIADRFGPWLVPVRSSAVAGGRVVQMGSFDSLRRLAEHYGHVVLHEQGDGYDAYSVEENGVTYRYRTANGAHP